jgi:hypothetical protein
MDVMANIFIIEFEYLNLKNTFIPIKAKSNIKGYIAGYICNAATNSP